MEIVPSARKHGVEEADILHACENAIRIVEYEYNGEDRVLLIGADRTGAYSNWLPCRVEDPTGSSMLMHSGPSSTII